MNLRHIACLVLTASISATSFFALAHVQEPEERVAFLVCPAMTTVVATAFAARLKIKADPDTIEFTSTALCKFVEEYVRYKHEQQKDPSVQLVLTPEEFCARLGRRDCSKPYEPLEITRKLREKCGKNVRGSFADNLLKRGDACLSAPQ